MLLASEQYVLESHPRLPASTSFLHEDALRQRRALVERRARFSAEPRRRRHIEIAHDPGAKEPGRGLAAADGRQHADTARMELAHRADSIERRAGIDDLDPGSVAEAV